MADEVCGTARIVNDNNQIAFCKYIFDEPKEIGSVGSGSSIPGGQQRKHLRFLAVRSQFVQQVDFGTVKSSEEYFRFGKHIA